MAQEQNKERITQASVKNLNISPRKVRLVTDSVKGKPVITALAQLNSLPNRSSGYIAKLIESGMANARNKNMNESQLVIDSITVDKGRVLKRAKPKARGRVGLVEKKQSHVNLVLREAAEVKQAPYIIHQKPKKIRQDKPESKEREKQQFKEPGERPKTEKKQPGFVNKFFRRKSI